MRVRTQCSDSSSVGVWIIEFPSTAQRLSWSTCIRMHFSSLQLPGPVPDATCWPTSITLIQVPARRRWLTALWRENFLNGPGGLWLALSQTRWRPHFDTHKKETRDYSVRELIKRRTNRKNLNWTLIRQCSRPIQNIRKCSGLIPFSSDELTVNTQTMRGMDICVLKTVNTQTIRGMKFYVLQTVNTQTVRDMKFSMYYRQLIHKQSEVWNSMYFRQLIHKQLEV